MQIRDKNGRPVDVVLGLGNQGIEFWVERAYYLDGEREDVSEEMIGWIEEYYENQIFEKWFDMHRKNRMIDFTKSNSGKYDA
jgi:hypothetical protein